MKGYVMFQWFVFLESQFPLKYQSHRKHFVQKTKSPRFHISCKTVVSFTILCLLLCTESVVHVHSVTSLRTGKGAKIFSSVITTIDIRHSGGGQKSFTKGPRMTSLDFG